MHVAESSLWAVYAIAVTACMFTAAIDYSPSNVPAVTNLGTMLLSLAKAAMKMTAVFPRSVKICSIPVSRISYSSAQCCIDDIQQNDRETYKPHCPRVRQNEPLNMPKRLFRFLRSVPATSQRWVPLRPMTGRPFASSAPGSPTPSSSAAPQSLTQRIKALTKQYGWWGLGVYIGISLLDLSLSYLVVHSLGAEKIGAVQDRVISYIRENCPWGSNSTPVHVPEAGMEESKPQMTTFWTEFILAYGIHKALIVARVPLTIAIVPPLARRFRGSI